MQQSKIQILAILESFSTIYRLYEKNNMWPIIGEIVGEKAYIQNMFC